MLTNISNLWGVYAAFHFTERSKHDGGINAFIDKVLFLQDNNIDVYVSCLAFPDNFSGIKEQIDFLKQKGVKNVSPRLFIGNQNGKYYPEQFEEDYINSLKKLKTCFEFDFTDFNYYTNGRNCYAGKKYFFMDSQGNLSRCTAINNFMGNLFTGNIHYNLSAKKCTALKCNCPFEGVFLSKRKSRFTKFFK